MYWHDEIGIDVNLFIAFELHWPEKGIRLRQDTRFPETPSTSLTMHAERPVRAALRIRIPEWLTSGGSVKLNGSPVGAMAGPGSYLTLSRLWKTGDRVEMTMPMHLRVESKPDDSKTQAFLYGPLVLAGDLGADGLSDAMIIGPNAPRCSARRSFKYRSSTLRIRTRCHGSSPLTNRPHSVPLDKRKT